MTTLDLYPFLRLPDLINQIEAHFELDLRSFDRVYGKGITKPRCFAVTFDPRNLERSIPKPQLQAHFSLVTEGDTRNGDPVCNSEGAWMYQVTYTLRCYFREIKTIPDARGYRDRLAHLISCLEKTEEEPLWGYSSYSPIQPEDLRQVERFRKVVQNYRDKRCKHMPDILEAYIYRERRSSY